MRVLRWLFRRPTVDKADRLPLLFSMLWDNASKQKKGK